MSQTCRRCSRVNPPEAWYCYHDGASLDAAHAGPLAAGLQPFEYPFVFPSGRCCPNFDELVLACDDGWDRAKEMLGCGFLGGFLDGLGRPDLARAAQQSSKHPDLERGLDQLLQQLPCTARSPARLAVQPLEINLGQLTASVAPRFTLRLKNHGGGLLHGFITAEADWLVLGDSAGSPCKVFQFRHDFSLSVQVATKNLRASAKPIEGRLVVETNGGTALVLIRVEVPCQPFPLGVLAGATTPRELAKKAKASPKEAALLFDGGAVRQWYEANGWKYPIRGAAAPGLAGVQQFFETLGLAKPPRVVSGERSVQLIGEPGAALQHILHLQAVEKKYIFAEARSTVDWLKIGGTTVSGQQGRVLLRVPRVPTLPGHRLHGFVQVTANGGQRLTVEVHLTVAGERAARTDAERIPVVGLDDLFPETLEVIPVAPTTLDELFEVFPNEHPAED